MRVKKDVTDPGSTASRYGERIHKILEDFVKNRASLDLVSPTDRTTVYYATQVIFALKNLGYKVLPELQVALTRKLEPCNWFDENVWLRSKLDLVCIKDNKIITLDWKTGSPKNHTIEALDQLDIAALQLFRHYPETEQIAAQLVYIPEIIAGPENPRQFFHPVDQLKLIADVFNDVIRIEEAETNDVWNAKPGNHCNWCPCKMTCPSAQWQAHQKGG